MCGIAGFTIDGQRDWKIKKIINDMANVLAHRGPDDEGFFINDNIALAHRRLSIIDLKSGRQPIMNEDGSIVIVLNGEIYNYKELRHELEIKGHKFYTNTDTENIVHLYEELGKDFVKKLNGIFALAIWDKKNSKLLLCRDRIGVKPLFYSILNNNAVIFASEIKAILKHPLIKKNIDICSLDDFFSLGYITGGKTIIKDIKSLPPGALLSIDRNSVEMYQYWDIYYKNEPDARDEDYYIKNLLFYLDKAVKTQLVSDVPVGIFLSGGLDSSCVLSLASVFSKNKIKTFSIGFSEQSYDELRYARMVSDLFATEHKDMTIKPNIIENYLYKLIWFYDEPFSDTSAIPTYYLSKLAASDLKVVLSGDGGDENFSGYPTYIADRLAVYYKFLPKIIKNLLSNSVNRLPISFDKFSLESMARRFIRGASLSALEAHYSWRLIYTQEDKEKLFSYDFKKQLHGYSPYKVFEDFYAKPQNGATVFQRLAYVDFKTWLVDDILRKVDRASMANSLEVRVPLLEHELVEFAAEVPDSFKLRGLRTKYLFKQALKNKLPRKIIYRKKSGFNAPVSYWINNDLKDCVIRNLSHSKIKKTGFFDADFIVNMLNLHFSGKQDNGLKLWTLLNFVIWHDIFIENGSQ